MYGSMVSKAETTESNNYFVNSQSTAIRSNRP
jgi:hypothetical protein